MRSRIIALLLIFTQCVCMVPAQELDNAVRRGRQRLEHYLDRAALERSAGNWERLAAAGLEAALAEWENGKLYLKESDLEQWQAQRGEAELIFGLDKERSYIEWTGRRLYSEKVGFEGSGLGAELRRAAAEWTYTRSDGQGTREINMAEAGQARVAWNMTAKEIIDRYLSSWEAKNLGAYSELRERFSSSGLDEAEREALYGQLSEEYREYMYLEYTRIAAAEGNDLMRVLLYDSQSLKKQKSGEAAAAVARQLAEEVKAATEKETAKLFGDLDVLISGGEHEGITIEAGEWLASFRQVFETGLAKWDEAEYAFLAARSVWERDAEQAYMESEELWAEAYRKLEGSRQVWENELLEIIESGIREWSKKEKALAEEFETARQEFTVILAERKDNKKKLIEAQISIYDISRDLLEMARQALGYWYDEWDGIYRKAEDKYEELFGSQGPPGYEAGYISSMLENPDMNMLTADSGAGIEGLVKQLELWKTMLVEIIKRIFLDEIEQIEQEAALLIEQIAGLEELYQKIVELERFDSEIEEVRQSGDISQLSPLNIERSQYIAELKEQYPAYNIPGITRAELSEETETKNDRLAELHGYIEQLTRESVGMLSETMSAWEALGITESGKEYFREMASEKGEILLLLDARLWDSVSNLTDRTNGWLILAQQYRNEADNAVIQMYRLCGIDINRLEMEGYGDELAAEVLKAQAVLKFWEEELQVAAVLDEYAQSCASTLESAEETLAALENAKNAYQDALAGYNIALENLKGKETGINEADIRYHEAEAELGELGRAVQEARGEYLALMAVIQGVSYEYICGSIIAAAERLEKIRTEAGVYEAYVQAWQAYGAALHAAELVLEIERIHGGGSFWDSRSALEARIAAFEVSLSATEIFANSAALLGEELWYGKELLEELEKAYEAADSGEKANLETVIQSLWETAADYYREQLDEAQRAADYLAGAGAPLFTLDIEEKRALELYSWLHGQRSGIAEELKTAGPERVMSLQGQLDILDELLLITEPYDFLNAINAVRDDIYLAEILRYENELGIAGQCAAWADYNKKRIERRLNEAEANEQILAMYGFYTTESVNTANSKAWAAIGELKAEFEAALAASGGYADINIISLAAYIQELREAGAGLNTGGGAALDEYIKTLLEYAAVKDASLNVTIDAESLNAAYLEIYNRYYTIGGWQENLGSAAGFLRVLGGEETRRLSDAERNAMLQYGTKLLLAELGAADLAAATDFDKFLQYALDESEIRYWAQEYCLLNEELKKELYTRLMNIWQPAGYSDEYDEIILWYRQRTAVTGNPVYEAQLQLWAESAGPALAAWYITGDFLKAYDEYLSLKAIAVPDSETLTRIVELNELFAGPPYSDFYQRVSADSRYNVNKDAAWYCYYLAGPELLYIYLSSPQGFAYIEEAVPYLGGAGDERVEKLLSYFRIENLAFRYKPLLDGDARAWAEKQDGLTNVETEKLFERLAYGAYYSGLEYYLDIEQALMCKGQQLITNMILHDITGIYTLIQDILKRVQAELYSAEAYALYAAYAEKENLAGYSWVSEFIDMNGLLLTEEITNEQREVIEYVNGESSSRTLERLYEKILTITQFFAADPYTGPDEDSLANKDKEMTALFSAMGNYLNATDSEASIIKQMQEYLRLYTYSQLDEKEREDKKTLLESALGAAQSGYMEYRQNEYKEAIEGIQAAYAAYNEAAAELNREYGLLNGARLEVRIRQELYDWAASVYLNSSGGSVRPGYETPREKLGRIQYAYERAKVSLEVLEALGSGSPLENLAYSDAMKEYAQATEKYYLGLAAAYEAELSIARQRQILTEAQQAEQAARAELIKPLGYLETGEPLSLLAYDMIKLTYNSSGIAAEVETVSAGGMSGAGDEYSDDFFRYFLESSVTQQGGWGDYNITLAESDTIKWLLELNVKLENNKDYFNDLMLAAVYMNFTQDGGDAKEAWYGDYLDPAVSDNYSLGPVISPEDDKFTAYALYFESMSQQLEAAYIRIMNTGNGPSDLAYYLLFRNSTLMIGGEDAEKAALIACSLQYVIDRAAELRNDCNNRKKAYNATAAGFALLLDFGTAGVWWALALAAGKKADQYQAIISTVTGLKTGAAENKEANDTALTDILGKWIEKYNKAEEERAKLNLLLYGSEEQPETESAGMLEYEQFSQSLCDLYNGELQAVDTPGVLALYTREIYEASEAGKSGSVTGAIEALNGYLSEECKTVWAAFQEQGGELKAAQMEARISYNAYVNRQQEIPADIREQLGELARRACDAQISAAEREAAAREYDELFRSIIPAQEIRWELEKLALEAWGEGTWNSYAADMSLIAQAADLHGELVRYERGSENYTQWASGLIKEMILAAVDRQNSLEREIEEHRLNLIAVGFLLQKSAWETQVQEIAARASGEWEKAKGRLNEGFNKWQREFADEYAAKTAVWEANYFQFVLDKQEWVEAQYVQAANVGNAATLEQAGANTGEAIAKALADTMTERMNREEFDTNQYVQTLLEGTSLSALMAYGGSLADRGQYGSQAVRQGVSRESVTAGLAAAKQTQETLNEELQNGAARLAAMQAHKLLDEAIQAYQDRLRAENESMWKWEQQMVRGEGYAIGGGGISREAVVDSTVWEIITAPQRVHRWEDFTTAPPQIHVNLEANALESLSPDRIMDLVGQAYNELEQWGSQIFGRTEDNGYGGLRTVTHEIAHIPAYSIEDDANRTTVTLRDGKFGEHVGYGPVMKAQPDFEKGRNANIEFEGSGQMGKILLDIYWNSIEVSVGWQETAKPIYDQKLWRDNGFVEPATMRSLADLNSEIAGVVIGAIASVYLTPVLGSVIGAAATWTSKLMDNLLFSSLDSTLTDRTDGEIWAGFGKTVAINTVTSGISAGAGAIGGAIANSAISAGTQALLQGLVSATSSYTSSVATSYLGALDFSTGQMDWDKANKSWYSANTIAGTLGAGVGAGLGSYMPSGLNEAQKKYLGGAISMGAGLAGELTRYSVYTAYNLASGMGINSLGQAYDDMNGLTLNLLGVGTLASMFGVRQDIANSIGTGLFELHLTSNGIYGAIGAGGIDISRFVYDLARFGIDSWKAQNAAKMVTELAGDMFDKLEYISFDQRFEEMMENMLNELAASYYNDYDFLEMALFRDKTDEVSESETYRPDIGLPMSPFNEYRMQDTSWADINIGDNYTIGNNEGTNIAAGCKIVAASQMVSTIVGDEITPDIIATWTDTNGGLFRAAIADELTKRKVNVETDYWQNQLNSQTLDNIRSSEGTTYILGHANIGGGLGDHWVLITDYTVGSNGTITYTVNPSSNNDIGRTFTSGSNYNSKRYATVDRIETYRIW